jgi:hypothetical protein
MSESESVEETFAMNPSTVRQAVTREGLLAMPNGENFELVGGELVERNMEMTT